MLGGLDRVVVGLAVLEEVIEAATQRWKHQIELLRTIPGLGLKVAQVIIAETGGNMAQFPSAAHLAAWAGVAPAIHESAGRRSPAGSRHGNKWLTSMLVEAASSAARSKNTYLAAQPARTAYPSHAHRPPVAVPHSNRASTHYILPRPAPPHNPRPQRPHHPHHQPHPARPSQPRRILARPRPPRRRRVSGQH